MNRHEERVAKNEALFREVNERVKQISEPFLRIRDDEDAALVEFVCECGREGCYEKVSLLLDEYEGVRARATQFVLVPGHETESVERVVRENRRYAVVEKHPDQTRVARATDPR